MQLTQCNTTQAIREKKTHILVVNKIGKNDNEKDYNTIMYELVTSWNYNDINMKTILSKLLLKLDFLNWMPKTTM